MRALVLLLAATGAAVGEVTMLRPSLCAAPQQCGCIEGVPLVVDCMERSLQEMPLTASEDYAFQWVLFLRGNPISHVPRLLRQDTLIKLSFKNTLVSSIEDSAFAELPKLKSLDFSQCKLTKASFTRDAFKGGNEIEDRHAPLPALEELDISFNTIESLEEEAFTHFTHLKSLVFTDNPIHDFTRTTIKTFTYLQNLTKLDLSRNKLTRLPNQFLAEMRNLEEFILDGNNFETVPQELSHSKSLRKISLDGNPILVVSAARSSALSALPSLEELSLSHMPYLRGVGPEGLSGLDGLLTLRMTDNPHMTYIDKLAFLTRASETAASLRELYLQNNRLTTLDKRTLNFDELTELNLEHNPWLCDCRLQWLTESMGYMVDSPSESQAVVCAAPENKLGVSVAALVRSGYEWPCVALGDVDPPYAPASGGLVVATIFLGVLLIGASTLICTYVLYQRSKDHLLSSRTVHYRRAADSDAEGIAHQMEA